MKNGDRIRCYQAALARTVPGEILMRIPRHQVGTLLELQDPLFTGCARVHFDGLEGEFSIQYEALELAPGYATPVT
jgi:hypothetical protein